MRTVAFIADSHFDELSRFEECVRVHDFIADEIARRGVDLSIHTGDIYERLSTPKERLAVARWVQAMTAIAPMLIGKGNHDAQRDLALLAELATKHELIVEEAAGVHCIGGCVVGALAWPNKANVYAMAQRVLSQQEGEQAAGEALRAVIRGLGAEMRGTRDVRAMDGAPLILAAHAMVCGSTVSTGQPLVGCDFEVGVDDLLAAAVDLVALGHIHKAQEWLQTNGCVVYPGSPRRTAFGELEDKGFVIATFDDDGRLVGLEQVRTPCAPMVLLEATWTGGDWRIDLVDAVGAEIRFRYTVPADQREAAAAAAEDVKAQLLDAGAVDVKLDPRVIPTETARAPEVARAVSTADKLRALWDARGTTPEPDRAERLCGKANRLEEGARCASND